MHFKYIRKPQFLTYTLISIFLTGCGGESSPLLVKNDNSGILNTGTQQSNNGDGQRETTNPVSSNSNYKTLSAAEILTLTGSGIIIGVNDSGFNIDNKPNYMLGDVNITNMYDFSNPSNPFLNNNYTPIGNNGAHGIAMAQIISTHGPDMQIIGTNALSHVSNSFDLYKAGIYLGEKGAKIINNSWSSSYSGSGIGDSAFDVSILNHSSYESLFKSIHDKDLLFVMSTGNNGIAESVSTARIPEIFPNFGGNFIAVTSQSESGKEVNHCGSAKDWCLTAPLNYKYFNPYDGYEYNSWGTSNATAHVTGVLSKVQQRYSWMTASQLQHVILGTADDIGDIGVDGVYGWGLLNESKALKGYGTFAWGTESFNIPTNIISYFDNNINGAGGFIKEGSGTLVLNGNNTSQGQNSINLGTVIINGSNSADFIVNNTGRLMVGQESNISTGSLVNQGTLEVMDSNLLVNGNFIQTSTGVLYANAGFQTNVAGNTDLDGKLVISSTKSGYVAPTNTSITILESANKINGEFDSLGYGNGVIKAFFDNTDNEVRLKLELGSVSVASSSQRFMGQDSANEKADNVMKSIQAKANSGQSISTQEASYYQQIAFSVNPSSYVFLDGSTTIKNSVQNLNIYQSELNNRLLSNAQGNNMFSYYDHSDSKTIFEGVHGKRESTARVLGGSHLLSEKTTIFGQVTTGKSKWDESMSSSTNSANIDFQGVTIGLSQNFDDINLFAIVGRNKTKTTFKGNEFDGSQNFYGLGINKNFIFDNWSIKPQLAIQKLENKFTANNTIESINSQQTTLTLSMESSYKINDKLEIVGNISYDKDSSVKNNLRTNTFGVIYNDNKEYLPNERISGSLGINYTPVENLTIYANISKSSNSNWSNKTFNTGVKWQF